MKKTELEPKERQVFEYICEKIRENGYSPSIRDICTDLDIKSTSTVHTCLDRLEKKGYIQKENGKSRTIRIEPPPAEDKVQTEEILTVPLIGRVAAGVPILAVENYDGYIHYPRGVRPMPSGELFALKVKGESMIEAGIMNGDVVIVERASTAENGEIVVAMIGDEATVKVFYRENGHYRLQPRNRTMLPMIVSQLTVLGKVVASIRYYN